MLSGRVPVLPGLGSPLCTPRTAPSAWSGWSRPPATRVCCGTRACGRSWWVAWAAAAMCTTCCAFWPCTPMVTRWAARCAGRGASRGGGRAGVGRWGPSLPACPTPGRQPAVPHLQGHLRREDGHPTAWEDGIPSHPTLVARLR